MSIKALTKVYLYTRFERLWHRLQALMIIVLLVTGFEVHGTYTLLGFKTAVKVHNFVGLSWLILFAFFVFWLLTTGEWKQYIPTTRKLWEEIYDTTKIQDWENKATWKKATTPAKTVTARDATISRAAGGWRPGS